jgi:hypothetical protein
MNGYLRIIFKSWHHHTMDNGTTQWTMAPHRWQWHHTVDNDTMQWIMAPHNGYTICQNDKLDF